MRTPYLIVLLSILGGCQDEPVKLRAPERSVTADEILTAFTTNEIAARRDFENTPVTVSGKIVLVTDGQVMLDTSAGPRVGVNVLPGYTQGMADLKAGELYVADCEGAFETQAVVGMMSCRPHK